MCRALPHATLANDLQLANGIRIVHGYAGLAAGAFLCVLGVSGSLLVFRPELERLTRPDLFSVPIGAKHASISGMAARAAKAVPGLALYRVRLPQDDAGSVEFQFGADGKVTSRVYVDPYQSRVLGTRASGDVFLWLQSLHFDLLAADTGRRINGGIGLALLVIATSGLGLWLRSRASWTARLRPQWRARSARLHWGLHIPGGFWLFPMLALMGATATYFAFHEPVAKLVCAVTFSRLPAPPPRVPQTSKPIRLDEMLWRAQFLEPTGSFTLVRLPQSPGQAVTLNYALPGDWSSLGANGIHFDPNTGAAIRIDRVREMPLGPRILAAFVPLHFGIFGGTATRAVWALLGLSPSLFFTTGLVIRRRRTSMRAGTAEQVPRKKDRSQSDMEVQSQ